jgi:hypothetical protein
MWKSTKQASNTVIVAACTWWTIHYYYLLVSEYATDTMILVFMYDTNV